MKLPAALCIVASAAVLCSSGYGETVEVKETILRFYEYEFNNTSDDAVNKPNADDRLEFAPGIVSQKCLQCICNVESQCKPIGCRMDVGSLSCGYFQIKLGYWTDCGKPGPDWKTCANNMQCASKCVQNYMVRYARHYGCPATCEGYAREHNGGPRGCKNPNTIPYWKRVQKQGC
ncbi:lysozyme-like [Mya arenaria]|uniref:lysozyme-like n=1 Tax=Mya arenaria TaxID=6604 RepID=UPI0022E8C2BD|nr:lysozyme-like [Mya arenaria]